MKRSFVIVGLVSLSFVVWSGCAPKKKGCGRCKTPCNMPCGGADEAPKRTPTNSPCTSGDESFTDFGSPMKLADTDTLFASDVLADPGAYNGKYIRVVGKVHSVCERRGCWLRLGTCGGRETLFVKFTCPVEGRLIPMEAVGKKACVEGTLQVKDMSQEEARHYKEDAGASAEEIAKIVGPQRTVKMASPAARVAGL